MSRMREFFCSVYQDKIRRPGPDVGSLPENTSRYRVLIERLLRERKVTSVLDVGCGDWQIGSLVDWGNVNYTGIDIVPSVVHEVHDRYQATNRRFVCGDVLRMPSLPSADLLIMKDVMQHWLPEEIMSFIPLLKQYPLALITNDVEHPSRMFAWHSRWHAVDLTMPPFNLIGEILLVDQIRNQDPSKVSVLFRAK